MKLFGKSSFILFISLVIGAEILSRYLSPFRAYPTAVEVARNPIHRLGWPEYTAGRTPEGKDLVVFIGNSQGVGFEMENAEDIYFAQVKRHFERLYPNLHFENWSHGGIRTSNVELLVLQARRRGAKKIVFLLHHDNFDARETMRVDYSISDIPLLLADHHIGRHKKELMMNDLLRLEDRLGLWLKANFHTYRVIEYWRFQSANWIPKSLRKFVFGEFIPTGGVLDFRRFPELKKKYHENWEAMGGKPLEKMEVDSTEFVLRINAFLDFQNNTNSIFKNRPTELIWVFPAVNIDVFEPKTVALSQSIFYSPAISHNPHSHNLTLSLSANYFISRGHLNQEGHRHMADLLIKTLEHEF